jgi:hypothetical protein
MCLEQLQIWLQAPDSYTKYSDFETSSFHIKVKCTRCFCALNQLPCTIFCQCPNDCQDQNVDLFKQRGCQPLKVSSNLLLFHALHLLIHFVFLRIEISLRSRCDNIDRFNTSNEPI